LDVTDLKNFCPVTNLSTISKILERLALARLKPHTISSQSAYRQGRSTETAICKILDDVISSIDDGHVVAMMSLDISAAFDSVTYDVLLQLLDEEFGVTGTCRQWSHGYLTGRSFTVRVGQSTSSPILMTTGVPVRVRHSEGPPFRRADNLVLSDSKFTCDNMIRCI